MRDIQEKSSRAFQVDRARLVVLLEFGSPESDLQCHLHLLREKQTTLERCRPVENKGELRFLILEEKESADFPTKPILRIWFGLLLPWSKLDCGCSLVARDLVFRRTRHTKWRDHALQAGTWPERRLASFLRFSEQCSTCFPNKLSVGSRNFSA